MAPALQGVREVWRAGRVQSLCGLFARSMTAGPDVSADEILFCFAGFDALDISAGCPRPPV